MAQLHGGVRRLSHRAIRVGLEAAGTELSRAGSAALRGAFEKYGMRMLLKRKARSSRSPGVRASRWRAQAALLLVATALTGAPATVFARGSSPRQVDPPQQGTSGNLSASTNGGAAVSDPRSDDVDQALREAKRENADLMVGLSRLPDGDPGVVDAKRLVEHVRELVKKGDTESVRALSRLASQHGSALRTEISDLLVTVGERATPGLLLEWRMGSTPGARLFAGTQLETMERNLPGEAVQTKSQDVLAEVLRAYGTAKDRDALGVVFSFTNADRQVPREAARQAIFDYGGLATGKLRESYASFMNRPVPDDWTPERVARELFVAYDRDRRKEMYVLLDEGIALGKRAQATTPADPALLEAATAAFDKILARAPTIERRAEMVPAYVLLAKSLEESAPERAGLLYQKAKELDSAASGEADQGSHRAAQIESGLLGLEARSLRERGVRDEDTARRAVALDPANSLAQSELARLDDARSEHRSRLVKIGWAGGAIAAVGIALLALFGAWRRFAH